MRGYLPHCLVFRVLQCLDSHKMPQYCNNRGFQWQPFLEIKAAFAAMLLFGFT